MGNSVAIGAAYQDQNLSGSSNILANIKTGIVGYTTGSKSVAIPSVTQATSKATGVTLNAAAGQITMNNAALANATAVSFVLTNNQIGTNDVLMANISSGYATAGSYSCQVLDIGNGVATIQVTNNSGGSLSEALVINFATLQLAQQ
jgi:hypothetical protein